MRLESIRMHDNGLRREVYWFDVSLRVGGDGLNVALAGYREERRLTRRHRTWMQLRRWDKFDRRWGSMEKAPPIPEDVAEEVVATLRGSISVTHH